VIAATSWPDAFVVFVFLCFLLGCLYLDSR
jgi:hypothetical protein